MTFEEARKNLIDLELREFAYDHAAGMLYFDGVTAAPRGTFVSRGRTLSVLNEEMYRLTSSEAAHETLRVLAERRDELSPAELSTPAAASPGWSSRTWTPATPGSTTSRRA